MEQRSGFSTVLTIGQNSILHMLWTVEQLKMLLTF